jgi:hypothetical protein
MCGVGSLRCDFLPAAVQSSRSVGQQLAIPRRRRPRARAREQLEEAHARRPHETSRRETRSNRLISLDQSPRLLSSCVDVALHRWCWCGCGRRLVLMISSESAGETAIAARADESCTEHTRAHRDTMEDTQLCLLDLLSCGLTRWRMTLQAASGRESRKARAVGRASASRVSQLMRRSCSI